MHTTAIEKLSTPLSTPPAKRNRKEPGFAANAVPELDTTKRCRVLGVIEWHELKGIPLYHDEARLKEEIIRLWNEIPQYTINRWVLELWNEIMWMHIFENGSMTKL